MSARTRRLAPVVAVLPITAGLLALPPSAAADPPDGDDRTLSCRALLAQAAVWPGTGTDGQRLFSDAYERYLLSQPECSSTAR